MTDPTSADAAAPAAAPPSPERPVPTGAEAFAEVCRILDVTQTGEGHFTGRAHPHVNGRIYGGQVFAQAIIAAARTVPEDRFAHSVHGYFLRPGNVDLPIEFAVEELHDGRSFSARRTHALQNDVPILSLIASFQEEQDGFEHRQDAPPHVPRPEELPSSDLLFRNPEMPQLTRAHLMPISLFDIRHVQREIFTGPDPEASYTQAVWIRAHGAAGLDRPQRQGRAARLRLRPPHARAGPAHARPGLDHSPALRREHRPRDVVAPRRRRHPLDALRPVLPRGAGRARAGGRPGLRRDR